jgi:hypothetical protein
LEWGSPKDLLYKNANYTYIPHQKLIKNDVSWKTPEINKFSEMFGELRCLFDFKKIFC